jgi:hypothetical protein
MGVMRSLILTRSCDAGGGATGIVDGFCLRRAGCGWREGGCGSGRAVKDGNAVEEREEKIKCQSAFTDKNKQRNCSGRVTQDTRRRTAEDVPWDRAYVVITIT